MEEYIAPKRKRIPYGMMNFAVIRHDDCYYVDKTRFIPIIEDADKFFLLQTSPPFRQKSDGKHVATLLRHSRQGFAFTNASTSKIFNLVEFSPM